MTPEEATDVVFQSHLRAARIERAAVELRDAAASLRKLYNADGEFICCITPPLARDMTARERKNSKTWSAFDRLRDAIAALDAARSAEP